MKEFDVHYILSFSDFFGSIEANSKYEAKEIARQYLTESSHRVLIERLCEYLANDDFEFEFTDILEVGKDI